MDETHPSLAAGDPACWLGRVCSECGALTEGSPTRACWRCGREPDEKLPA